MGKLHIFRPPDIRKGFNYNQRLAFYISPILALWPQPWYRRIKLYHRLSHIDYSIELTIWCTKISAWSLHLTLTKLPLDTRVAITVWLWEQRWRIKRWIRSK